MTASPRFFSRNSRPCPDASLVSPPSRVAGPARAVEVSSSQLETIASASVGLAFMAPKLAQLAGRMEEQANEQARSAGQIAEATRVLTTRLEAVVARLQGASRNVQEVMGEIVRIADQTRIISINASIEAARAGEQGRAFNVVAQEVQSLADQTRRSTGTIDERVQEIHGSVREVAAAVARDESLAEADSAVTVHAVNTRVQAMAGTAVVQREGAHSLHQMGDQAKQLAEDLLMAVGTFRLPVHRRAADDLHRSLPEFARVWHRRRDLEGAFHRWLATHPAFELFYATDADGQQITDNIVSRDGKTVADPAGFGRDWRQRPWFSNALRTPNDAAVTDIYRSTATGDFCFTISAVVHDADGSVLGVLGADVNFQKLVARL